MEDRSDPGRDWRPLTDAYRWRPTGRPGAASEGVAIRGPGVEVAINDDGSVLVRPGGDRPHGSEGWTR